MSTLKSANAPADNMQAGDHGDSSEKNTTSVRGFSPVTSSNPGSLEEMHRKCREVFPMCFDGARMMLTKAMSSHFQVTHTLSISPQNTGYRFGATYVGTKATQQEGESFPVLLADTDISGNTSATFLHQFGDRWRVKMQAQTQGNKLATTQGGVEYRGRLTTLGLTCANIDIINDSGVVVAQYLRRITKKLDLGVEFIHQYGIPIPGRQLSIVNYQARYTGKNFIASGMFSFDALHLCYYHKQRDNISFGVEFESSTRSGEAVTTIGYQAEIPDEGVTMRASVNTDWSVGAVFEKKLSRNLPFTLAISGMLNHVKAQGKFGIGLIIDVIFDGNNDLDLINPLITASFFQSIMVESVISENKIKLPSCGLPRIYRKYAPDKSRKIHLPEVLALNPGTLSNFHKECLACISNHFTGLHFAINKFIPSTGVKLKNKLRIGTTEVNDELITKYMTTRQTRFGKHDMLVEAMTNFKTPWPLISISQIFDDFWYMSIAYSLQEKKLKSDVEVEYYGRLGTLALKYTSCWPSNPVATCSISYLRSITQKLALGSQLTLCSSSMRSQPNQQLSDVTYYARYRGPTYIACLDFCKTNGYHFSYFRNINEYLACAINITGSIDDYTQLRSTIGIKTKIPEYGLIIRGNLANDGAICGIVKKQFIKDFPIKIMISGSYNLFAGDYSFGIGFSA